MNANSRPIYPDQKLVLVVTLFERLGIPYAVGGAIALLYWGEPRATVDIDINVFLPSSSATRIADALVGAGIANDTTGIVSAINATAQVRVDFAGSPLDLFFSDVPFHDSCEARKVRVPFGDIAMNVLSAEDLVICKVMFNRSKDWMDIEQVLRISRERFDAGYVRRWLGEMLGPGDERAARMDALAGEIPA